MSIKITADRMIDLSVEEQENLKLTTMPCYINMDGKSFNDSDDIFPDQIFQYFETTGKLAKTAAKSPDDYYDFFKQFVDNGQEVIHFAASSGISAICNHAKIAAERFEGKVVVIDTLTLSNGAALLLKRAIMLMENGEKDIHKIAQEIIDFIPRISSTFLIEDLIYLYKGGRCSTMSFYAANLLKIKPVIFLDANGRMQVREKVKGKKEKALTAYIKKSFELNNPVEEDIYFVLTSYSEETKALIQNIIFELGYSFKNVYFNHCSCNCAVHSGRNTVGMSYIIKKD